MAGVNVLRAVKRSVAAVLALLCFSNSFAQDYPNKPIRFIWPYTAGAGNGNVARVMMEEVGKILGQPVIIEYKTGAGGRFGLAEVMKQPRDDYVIAGVQEAIVSILPFASATFRAEPGKDYRPVVVTHEVDMVLTGHAKLPFDDVKGMVAYAKARPEKPLTFGSSGIGGTSHIFSEQLFAASGMTATHIPYRGNAQALADRMSGTVDLYLVSADTKPYVDAGQVKVIAVTGSERHPVFPNAPTLKESGVNAALVSWGGLVMPAGTPDDVLAKVNKAVNQVLARADIKKAYADIGYKTRGGTPQEMEERIKADRMVYVPLVKKLGIKFE